jgi:hypothetical protein
MDLQRKAEQCLVGDGTENIETKWTGWKGYS